MNSRTGLLELPIYSQLVRRAGDNLGLELASEVWECWGGGGGPERNERLTCGIGYSPQVDRVTIKLIVGYPAGTTETSLLLWGKPHIWQLEVSEVK